MILRPLRPDGKVRRGGVRVTVSSAVNLFRPSGRPLFDFQRAAEASYLLIFIKTPWEVVGGFPLPLGVYRCVKPFCLSLNS